MLVAEVMTKTARVKIYDDLYANVPEWEIKARKEAFYSVARAIISRMQQEETDGLQEKEGD